MKAGEQLFIFAGGWDRTVSVMDGDGRLLSSVTLDTVVNDLVVDPSGTLIVVGNKGLIALRYRARPQVSQRVADGTAGLRPALS